MAMRLCSVITALCFGLVAPAAALGAGGPVPPLQDGNGIANPGSPFRYVAVGAGKDTVVRQLTLAHGRVKSAVVLPGQYGIPGVDYSGFTTGLSADGRTLIVAPLFGNRTPRRTRLLALNATHLAVQAKVLLPGWFTVDAISPDGRWLYLIHYLSSNVTSYEVRAYDLAGRRLIAKPVADPQDHGEAMTGIPVTRVMSIGGRWAYTLYVRPTGVPFIHALDTAARHAVCVDLPSLANADLGSAHLRLGAGGATVRIDTQGGPQATVDTHTFAVTPAPTVTPGITAFAPAPNQTAPNRSASQASGGTGDGGSSPWVIVALLVVAFAAFGAAVRRRAGTRVT
jgi:hypothetical protein